MNITGLIKFLELLPVLQVVENHPKHKKYKEKKPPQTCAFCKKEFDLPRQLKYCSAECRVEATKQRNTNDYTKVRTCPACENPMPLGRRTYCSDECQKEQILANNRNPFSSWGTGGEEFDSLLSSGIPTHYIASDALEQAELYIEHYGSGIKEDMDELNQIIMEENRIHPAYYRKDIRSPRESGKEYWSVKSAENQRRKKAGLPKLSSMRTSNLEHDLVKQEKRKKRNPVIAIREENYQAQKNNIAFASIGYNPRTKSGMLKSELVAKINAKNKS